MNMFLEFQTKNGQIQDPLSVFPSVGIMAPQVNICPPSPQNNVDPKTGNFN